MKNGEIVIYKSEDGHIKVDVLFEGETVWLTQAQICDLFGKSKSTISEHIKNIFEEGELNIDSVVRNFRTTASDGKEYDTNYYNLDVIISVGYRVKSHQGTQFRIWATQRLREYIIKGFTLNDERFTSGSSMNYFKELLDRIRQIRLSERVFYQQVKDIYATSIDYDPSDEMTLTFYKEVQNKLLWAVSGKTAAELIYYRSNATLPMMGLTSTSKPGKVTKADVLIGKMKDWIDKLRMVLTMNEKTILECAGTISHELAVKKVGQEYAQYKEAQKRLEHLNSIKELDEDIKKIAHKKKPSK